MSKEQSRDTPPRSADGAVKMAHEYMALKRVLLSGEDVLELARALVWIYEPGRMGARYRLLEQIAKSVDPEWTEYAMKPVEVAILEGVERLRTRSEKAPMFPDEHTAMLLAAISTASIQNTRESAKERVGRDNPYCSQAYLDVCAAVDREMAQRERAEKAEAQFSATPSAELPLKMDTGGGDLEILRMALGNTAACLGDALATFNRLVGEEVFRNSTPPSATERRDEDRMEWLSVPGRWITPHEGDLAQSFHVARKQAHFYIEGKYTVTEGATARAAIDSAMRATKNPADRKGVQK